MLPHLSQMVDVFSYQPYSTDLAPSDFHLFPGIKRDLGWQFTTEDELHAAIASVWSKKKENWYYAGTDNSVYRYN